MSHSPDDVTPIDDQLLAALLADDAALAAGRSLDPELSGEAEDLRACLLDLESLWPRGETQATEEIIPANPGILSEVPSRFGRFEVIRAVGRGGFGVVFRARDPRLGREVALKVPRPDVLLTAALRKRFLREARAAAALDHPHIVPIYDADMLGPFCYIASAFCEGPTLSAWLRSRTEPVPPRLAARLLQALAEAVQHAHDRGILHRDLKPSNVLLQLPMPGRPETEIVPRITDFGLAKIIEEGESEETRSQALVGSPPYMAPEQATGKAREVGPPTDVYALGATLYQILTGRPPFTGESRTETLFQVITTEPIPPRTLRPGLPRDLETIGLKCLEKNPKRRYPTADALADDLGRFLRREPILARPASVRERAWKWARRRPSQALAVAMLVLTALILILSNALLQTHNQQLSQAIARADRHARDAERARQLTDRFLRDAQLRLADQALELGQYERAQDLLDAIQPGPDGSGHRGFVWQYLRRRSRAFFTQLHGEARPCRWLVPSPDGRTVAAVDKAGTLVLWDLPTEQIRARLSTTASSASSPVFSMDGRLLAAFEADASDDPRRGAITIWSMATNQPLAHLRPDRPVDRVEAYAFLTEGILALAWVGRDERHWVDLWGLSSDPARPHRIGRVEGLEQVAFAAGHGTFAAVEDGQLTSFEVASGRLRRRRLSQPPLKLIRYSPDGRLLVVFEPEDVVILDADTGNERARLTIPQTQTPIAASADGRILAIPDALGLVHLWDRDTRKFRDLRADGTEDHIELQLALSPDGRRLAVACRQPGSGAGPVTLWDVASGDRLAIFPGRADSTVPLTFTIDGHSVLLHEGSSIRRWLFDREVPASIALAGHTDEAWSVAFSPDGQLLATGSNDITESQTIKLWDATTGRLVSSWSGSEGTVAGLAFHPNGRFLATGHLSDGVRLWDVATGRQIDSLRGHTGALYAAAFSPDGKTLATAGTNRVVQLWDLASGQLRATLEGHANKVRGLAFTPGGRTLATAAQDRTIRLWDVATGTPKGRQVIGEDVMAIAFRSDGEFLAAAGKLGTLVLWDIGAGLPPRFIHSPDYELQALALSPDGQILAVAGQAGKIILWDTVAGQELLTLDGHDATVHDLAFSPDGSRLASCDHNGTVRLWFGRSGPSWLKADEGRDDR